MPGQQFLNDDRRAPTDRAVRVGTKHIRQVRSEVDVFSLQARLGPAYKESDERDVVISLVALFVSSLLHG
jgi:hypothetical protein